LISKTPKEKVIWGTKAKKGHRDRC